MSTVPAWAQPGDLVAFETKGFFGFLIGIGQWIRRSDRRFRNYHHIAVLVDFVDNHPDRSDPANWCAVQAARRVDEALVDDIARERPFLVLACPEHVDRERVVAQADAELGKAYGVLTILAIAFQLLTPRFIKNPISFRRTGTYICSGLGAWCLHAGGYMNEWAGDIYDVMPADIVRCLTASRC